MAKTIPASALGANSATGTGTTFQPLTAGSTTTTGNNVVLPTGTGFNLADLEDMVLLDKNTGAATKINYDYRESITDIILQQNMLGVSTITIQMTDPSRAILRKGFLKQGMTLQVASTGIGTAGSKNNPKYISTSALSDASLTASQAKKNPVLEYTLTQFVKASDQVQLVFEAEAIYRLQNQRGNGTVVSTTSTNVTPFVKGLVEAINNGAGAYFEKVSFAENNPDYASVWKELTGNNGKSIVSVALSRGTSSDPYEDSWTAASRIASSIGWRIWENGNTVYFGPDEWWQGNIAPNGIPPINALKGGKIKTIEEFTDNIQLIDFDWDVGKAYGQATITCMLDNWEFDIGEIVKFAGLGPADSGLWMVTAMQRDAFNPQASIVLQVPMPFGAIYDPTSQPQSPFPLPVLKSTSKKVVK